MSESFYIGLSRKQVESLLAGKKVGKRPYYKGTKFKDTRKFNGMVRVYVTMLTEEEQKEEPEKAFEW